jgi:anthraniloyl-CoA monooxygenase
MRVLVVGGGPGGLYAGTLLKRVDPASHVTVLERNPPHEAYGFGVVFSEQTMRGLERVDERTFRALTSQAPRWDSIEFRHRGETLTAAGHRFWAITRARLLEVLQEQARAEEVELRFEHEVRDLADLEEHDLLVAADGVNSLVRRSHAGRFETSERFDRSNYIWLGCTKRFDSFTFIFEEDVHGAFGAHIYPIGDELSTFVVDAGDETLRSAGLSDPGDLSPGASDERSLAHLEGVFAEHLDGHRLIANNSRWLKFRELRNERWRHGHVVLLGDAAHTAHPNVGSGTKMALDDAIALCEALRADDDVGTALQAYEHRRAPAVARISPRTASTAPAMWSGCTRRGTSSSRGASRT